MRPLYTIGYEGTEISRFVRTLLDAGVEVLADVRAIPLSRKRGFSKKALVEFLSRGGIRYIHFKALGDPKPGREAARAGRMAEFRSVYSRHLETAEAIQALGELARTAETRTTCLMCFERDPSVCHRSMVTARLWKDSEVSHLYADVRPP